MTDSDSIRIVRYSRMLRGLCFLAFVGLPAGLASMWFFAGEAFLRSGAPVQYLVPHGVGFDAGRLDPTLRLLGFAVSMVPGALAMWALWNLATLFGCFSRLEFFTARSVRCFRLFATAVLLTGLARPLASGLMSVVTTLGNAPGNRYLAFTMGDSELTAMFLGVVLLVVARVMEQGQKISEENQQFV